MGTAYLVYALSLQRPPSTSELNFTVLQRKNWHRSLHSITWSHNSQSHTHRLMHFYTQAKQHIKMSSEYFNQLVSTVFISSSLLWSINFLYIFVILAKEWAHNPLSGPLHLFKLLNSSTLKVAFCSWGSVAYTELLPAVDFIRYLSPQHSLKVGSGS